MAAPKGNQFWKLADPSCLGRPLIFKTPLELWSKAKEYFQYCDENPFEVVETVTGSKRYEKITRHKIPYTWEGLYAYLGISHLDDYKKRKDFSGIIRHIGNIIRNQKFSGAAAGLFNANIIARDLGLRDKHDHTSNGETLPAMGQMIVKRIPIRSNDEEE